MQTLWIESQTAYAMCETNKQTNNKQKPLCIIIGQANYLTEKVNGIGNDFGMENGMQ